MKSAKLVAAALTLALAGSIPGIGFAGATGPSPADCFDERLCGDLSDVHYCPDTGDMVGAFGACPSLVTGPYAPGGLRPNEGLGDYGD